MKKKLFIISLVLGFATTANAQFWRITDPVKLGGTVNTGAEESIPVFSKDSAMLYFVRTFDDENKGGENDQDIWFSKKESAGTYTDCERLKSLNNKYNNAILGLGGNGSKMYVLNSYEGKKDQSKGIAVSEGEGTDWSSPSKLEVPGLDIEGEFYGFHVGNNEKVIIISHAGPESLGEEDLYVSTLSGGSWSQPLHMGSAINSAGFEISPFLSESMDTLFFSSNGFGGEGDADIFYSVKQGDWMSWSAPQNLGNVINSPKFDAYFSYHGDQAYWSSNRDADRSDIYMVDILTPPALSASCIASNATVNQGEDGSIDLSLEGGVGPYTFDWSNGQNTEDVSGLTKGDYSVTVTDALGQTANSTCTVDEPAPIIAAYKDFSFKHNFEYNKNKLTTAKGDLNEFVKGIEAQLEDGRTSVTISVVSSASQVPTKTFGTNEKLAQTRAENIKKDLENYFSKKFGDKVTVEIASVKIDGPAYVEDSSNRDKYAPYQFVSLSTK